MQQPTAAQRSVSGRMECRICWHTYDPDAGDEARQVPPGTPFGELPDDWRCPECDAEASLFLPEAG